MRNSAQRCLESHSRRGRRGPSGNRANRVRTACKKHSNACKSARTRSNAPKTPPEFFDRSVILGSHFQNGGETTDVEARGTTKADECLNECCAATGELRAGTDSTHAGTISRSRSAESRSDKRRTAVYE